MRLATKFLLGIAALGGAVFTLTCWSLFGGHGKTVAVPTLPKSGPLELRVAYIENPALPTFTEDEWDAVLDVSAEAVRDHLGIELRFTTFDRLSMARVFGRLDAAAPRFVKDRIAPYQSPSMDWERMVGMIGGTLPETDQGIVEAHRYLDENTPGDIAPLEGSNPEERRESLARTSVVVLQERLDTIWRDAPPLMDGGAARAGKPGYNEWVYWDAIPSLDLPYDVYLTNQAIISVEFARYPLHIVLRGGITAGTTSGASEGLLGAASSVTAYPFLDETAEIVALRGGRVYARDAAIRYAGLLLAHELGHLLLHLDHPWDDPACLTYPVPALRFHEAAERLNADACPVGHNAAMTPGAVTLFKPEFSER